MAKGLKMTTTQRQINEYLASKVAEQKYIMLEMLDIAGEIAVKDQTIAHKYLNQTGNLSSSVGFVVLDNGRVYKGGGFEMTKDGGEGQKEGQQFLNSLIASNSRGLVLLVVAGMNYASYVEDMAKDVLTTAELTAEKIINQLKNKL